VGLTLQNYGKKWCNALNIREIRGKAEKSYKLQATRYKPGKQPKAKSRKLNAIQVAVIGPTGGI
jgi:hypothetical protein